jgi:DNA-binding LacI/PurR family transcriptional regulator
VRSRDDGPAGGDGDGGGLGDAGDARRDAAARIGWASMAPAFPARPTIADVARHAEVSTVTVSRVIEGSTKVAEATRDRVLAAMDAIGYFGNAAATSLVSGRAGTIAVVTSTTSDFGYATTISGIEQRARQHGMAVLIAVIEGEGSDAIRSTVRTVASHAVAGVVVLDFDPPAHAVIPALPAYLPAVSTKGPGLGEELTRPSVSIDEYQGAIEATEHLIALGHRTVFVLAPPHDETRERRSEGVQDALTAARLPQYPIIRCDDWKPRSGYAGTRELLDRYGDAVTALACANDEIAFGAIRAIYDLGLTVPGDVSVVGFDDDPAAEYTRPALTTVRQDFLALGSAAFDLLHGVLDGGTDVTLERHLPELVVRESTAAPNPRRGLRAAG